MRVFLTGSTGFVGSAVLRELVERGHETAVLLRGSSRRLWRVEGVLECTTRIEGDLSHVGTYEAALRKFAPGVMMHLAWDGVGNADRNDPRQVRNIQAATDLFLAATNAGVRHVVALGSQAEYGPIAGIASEDAATKPTTLYGISKLATGLALGRLGAEKRVPVAWLRLFSSYGPGDETYWMIPGMILQLLDRKKPALTPAEQVWDYCYVADVARAIVAAGERGAAGVFNLGSGSACSIRSIVERVRDEIDPALPLGFGDIPYRPDQVMHLQADISRLCAATGWEPTVGLDRGLRQTVEWYREHRDLVQQ